MSEEELENLLSVVIEDTTIASEKLRQYIKDLRNELNNRKEIEKSHQEENGKLRVEFEKVYEDNLTLANELKQEKEKNKELEKYEEAYKLLSYGLNNYISKDKIKEKIEQAEQKADDDNLDEYTKISAWKELLEEE